MNKKLILHLGVHKTATTLIQECMALARADLWDVGCEYIPLYEMRRTVTPHICSTKKKSQSILRLLANRTKKGMIISDENILGSSADILEGKIYPFAEPRVRRILRAFEGFDIRIVVCLRRPSDFLASMYCEYIRHYEFVDFEEYIKKICINPFSWSDVLEFLNEFPNVDVCFLPYESSIGGGVQRVLEEITKDFIDSNKINYYFKKISSKRFRKSFTEEELELFADILSRTDSFFTREFINLYQEWGGEFGEKVYRPLDSVRENVDENYHSSLRAMGFDINP